MALYKIPAKTCERIHLFLHFSLIQRTSGDSCLSDRPTTRTVTWLARDISRSCWYSHRNQKHRRSHILTGKNVPTKGVLGKSELLIFIERGPTHTSEMPPLKKKNCQMSSSFFDKSYYCCLILTIYMSSMGRNVICSENTPHFSFV